VGFARAFEKGDVQGALEADDVLHDVPITVLGNRALATTIERQLPLIRRLERLRFGSLLGRRSIAWHDELIDACAAGDVEAAVAVTTRIWTTLVEQIDPEGGTRDENA
jgi:DNA-binding GntR family transcriptional regulator